MPLMGPRSPQRPRLHSALPIGSQDKHVDGGRITIDEKQKFAYAVLGGLR